MKLSYKDLKEAGAKMRKIATPDALYWKKWQTDVAAKRDSIGAKIAAIRKM